MDEVNRIAVATYEGVVKKGRIELLDDVRLPDEVKVFVVVTAMPSTKSRASRRTRATHKKILTADQLLKSNIVGMWADRDDIGDSVEFARTLRSRAQRRSPEIRIP